MTHSTPTLFGRVYIREHFVEQIPSRRFDFFRDKGNELTVGHAFGRITLYDKRNQVHSGECPVEASILDYRKGRPYRQNLPVVPYENLEDVPLEVVAWLWKQNAPLNDPDKIILPPNCKEGE